MTRRGWIIALWLLAEAPGVLPAQAAAQIQAVGPIGITVSDLDRAMEFYVGILGFVPVKETEVHGPEWEQLTGVFGVRMRIARLRLGKEELELTQYLAPEGRPAPADTRSNDRWFQHVALIVSDMDSAYRYLRAHKVRHASTGPQRLPDSNPAAGGIEAFYFKDPDGHYLEILAFPEGKGDPRWQSQSQLFLGIDHTAIVVRDTEASLVFWRDLLGLTVLGGSRNYGMEQARLNNVEGASLQITALRAAEGPGVEFLEYLNPKDGRPYPLDARPNDLIHWHTTVRTVADPEVINRLGTSGVSVVSRGVAALPGATTGFARGVMVRDPDGHAVLITTP